MADTDPTSDSVAVFDRWWREWDGPAGTPPRPVDWPDTVATFTDRGLEGSFVKYAIGYAMRRGDVAVDAVWRYFCGMCWNHLRDAAREATPTACDRS